MIIHGNCLWELIEIDDESVDSLVTDPPAGISFMGKAWDHHRGGRREWVAWLTQIMEECYRVLKPGAHGVVWALPRTSHWTATALEDAGFEVRDVVTHLFGTGFPKSHDVSKAIDKTLGAEREVIGEIQGFGTEKMQVLHGKQQRFSHTRDLTSGTPATDDAKRWQGWGTALKPASEHWILVRKPLSEKTVAANVLAHGTGAINVDACRINYGADEKVQTFWNARGKATINADEGAGTRPTIGENAYDPSKGRFPANVVLSHSEGCDADCEPGCAAKALDEQSGTLKNGGQNASSIKGKGMFMSGSENGTSRFAGDSGGASRFFYVAKASKSDKGSDNKHPTVKSTTLMGYLICLVTPPNGTVLDPFCGSGSTGVAAARGGFDFIGIEREREHVKTAKKRLKKAEFEWFLNGN